MAQLGYAALFARPPMLNSYQQAAALNYYMGQKLNCVLCPERTKPATRTSSDYIEFILTKCMRAEILAAVHSMNIVCPAPIHMSSMSEEQSGGLKDTLG